MCRFCTLRFGDGTARAILDRFLQHAEIIPFKGKSYRLNNREKEESLNGFENALTHQ